MLDCETKPLTVYAWGLWKQNISINHIIDSSGLLCFSAKWLGSQEIYFYSIQRHGLKPMLKHIHALLEEADVVVHYNGQKFDIPVLNKEFLLADMAPPSTYQQIDLLRTARQRFRFPSNKLDFIANSLGLGKKLKHAGFDLWIQCMAGNPEAWVEMEKYNIQDVLLLEKVYHKLLPWIVNHPSHAVHANEDSCTNCGSVHLQRRGFAFTNSMKYQRYQCNDCGTWLRSKKAEPHAVTITKDKNG